jgi:sugar/nucleoside kinase (ribokinase family)
MLRFLWQDLDLTAALRAYVGDDEYGAQCIASLERDGVDTGFVEKQPGKHTNYHYVLWFESQRTILVKHEAFDYTPPTLMVPPKWLYLSSLSENSLVYHKALMEALAGWHDTKLAFQPGTFQMKFGVDALRDVYKRTDIFFCNKEEAERILGLPSGTGIKVLLEKVQKLGPKIVVITDDTRGSYARDEKGMTIHCPRYPDPKVPYEITGAGDALASTVVAALILGKSLDEALRWGATNASSVLQGIGAQKGLLTREELEKNLNAPPAPFLVETI